MLVQNRSLQELQLDRNHIGDTGAGWLARSLEQNQTLRDLWLIDNRLSKEGVMCFATALTRNNALQRLGITTLDGSSDPQLQEALVSMRRSQHVRQAMQQIEEGTQALNLEGHRLGDEGVHRLARAIEASKTLKELHLDSCEISDDGASALADLLEREDSSISIVSLEGNSISEDGRRRLGQALEKSTTLEDLRLDAERQEPPPHETRGSQLAKIDEDAGEEVQVWTDLPRDRSLQHLQRLGDPEEDNHIETWSERPPQALTDRCEDVSIAAAAASAMAISRMSNDTAQSGSAFEIPDDNISEASISNARV